MQNAALVSDYPALLLASLAGDVDRDAISFLITDVPAASGTLAITHGGNTSAVVPGVTMMVSGDTLTWTPPDSVQGQVEAFSIRASDGTALAAGATRMVVNTSPLAVISAVVSKG